MPKIWLYKLWRYIRMKKKKRHTVLIILLCVAFAWGLIAVLPRAKADANPFVIEQKTRPLLIAHGGGNREFPDNTLEACYNAYDADPNVMLELDVSLTKDGVIILSHDTTLDYRTNAGGAIIDWNYSDLIAEEIDFSYLNKLENGIASETVKYNDFNGRAVTPLDVNYPDGVTPRHNEIFLATTLKEVLIAFPHSKINVEIKQSGETGIQALEKVVGLLDGYDAFGRVVLASFHKEIYQKIKELKSSYPQILCSPEAGGVAGILITGWLGFDLFYNEPVEVLQVPMKQSVITVATRGFVATAHRHNIAVHFWTIDGEDDMRHLIDIGADGIMTNLPHLLKDVYDDVFG